MWKMENKKKNIWQLITVVMMALAISAMIGAASAKTLYLVADHHTGQFDVWNINPDGTTNYLNTYNIHHTDPAGIACWVPPKGSPYHGYIFITSEFSSGVEVVDASTFQYITTAPGPSNLAGVAVDHDNNIVYALYRGGNSLYAYDWDPATKSLTPRPGYPKTLTTTVGGYGIAYNEETDTLWVADGWGNKARAYNLIGGTWTEDTSKSFTPSHVPIDIVVDRQRNIVYTVSMSAGAATPWGAGSTILSKYDLSTNTETTGTLTDQGVGVAVDEVTGYVYVTISPYGQWSSPVVGLEVWDTSTTPWTQIQTAQVSGSPAGICVPKEEVVPPACLHIDSLDDGVAASQCVSPGDNITYQVSWSNQMTGKTCGVAHNATLVAELAPEVGAPSSITGGGTYDSINHTITWNLGDIPADDPGDTYQFIVSVTSAATPGGKITTYCTIDSDDTNPHTMSVQTDVCVPKAELCPDEYRWNTSVSPTGYEWDPYPTLFRAWNDVHFVNNGTVDAFNVTATITCAPVNVNIVDGTVTLGDIP
ncbi:MAG: hypothetical protein DRP08_07815, partial [Candidatus Aenigmatarchaeota archaeon]